MSVLFVNAAAQPVLNQEIVVATIAGPLDNLDAFVSAPAWADGNLYFYVYATVGGVRAKVATSLYQGPKAGRLQWSVGSQPAAAPVHAGGTSYDLVVLAQATQNSFLGALSPSQPPAIRATFAGVNQGDVAADANVSATSLVGSGETTIATATGFNQVADVAANMNGMPSLDFRLYASCGAGSVEALIAEQTSQGPDGIATLLHGVALPVATSYRLACAQTNPGGPAVNVTASLSTYEKFFGGLSAGLSRPLISVKEFGAVGDGIADEAPAFQRAIDALAGTGVGIWIPAGDYRFSSSGLSLRSGIMFWGSPNARLITALPPGPAQDATTVLFFAPTGIGATTTLTANVLQGDQTCQVAADIAAVGDSIILEVASLNGGGQYRVIAKAGVGPFTYTLDRPVLWDTFLAGNVAGIVIDLIHDVAIEGNGMIITGVCQRYGEFAICRDCYVRNVHFDTTLGFGVPNNLCWSFDTASLNCGYEHVVSHGPRGIGFESNEAGFANDCSLYGENPSAAACGLTFSDSVACSVRDCELEGWNVGAGCGLLMVAQGSTGCFDCNVYGGNYTRCFNGVHFSAGGRYSMHGGSASECTAGFFCDNGVAGAYFSGIAARNCTDGAFGNGTVTDAGIIVDGLHAHGAVVAGTGVLTSNSKLRVRGLVYTGGDANGTFVVLAAAGAEIDLSDSDIILNNGTGGTSFGLVANGTIRARDVQIHLNRGAGAVAAMFIGAAGKLTTVDSQVDTQNGSGGLVALQDNAGSTFRSSRFSYPVGATFTTNGFHNRGQVVGAAGATVATSWPDLKPEDRVSLVVHGSATAVPTPGVALTPGTGFTIGIDASVSTWDYVVH